MQAYEIIIIIAVSLFVVIVFGLRIYKKVKGLPSDECEDCHKKTKKLLKKYHKMYSKNCDNHHCQCEK